MNSYDQTIRHIVESPTVIYGLKFKPSIEPFASNDQDGCLFDWPTGDEVSDCNLETVEQALSQLGSKCKVIVEIGVHRNRERSITNVLMSKKPSNCIYLGIDLDDKSHLDNPLIGIYTIRSNSHDQAAIRNRLMSIGAYNIDFLFIDGWHSVNTCINDWMYTDLLTNHGIVGIHDTNAHPGPIALYHAIDEKLFTKQRYCIGPEDMGIALAWHQNGN